MNAIRTLSAMFRYLPLSLKMKRMIRIIPLFMTLIVAAVSPVQAAQAQGIPPEPLRARAWGGRTTYRTGIVGWYLKRNGSLGVDTEGNFYVLSAPTSLRARLRGVTLEPSDPPLVVGVGGRDGESMPLQQLLDIRLAAGTDW